MLLVNDIPKCNEEMNQKHLVFSNYSIDKYSVIIKLLITFFSFFQLKCNGKMNM